MSKNILTAMSLLLMLSARSQHSVPVEEEWTSHPSLHPADDRYKKEPAVILLDKKRIEYFDEGKDVIVAYRTQHKIVRVNDNIGIESFNKIYLGISDTGSIVNMRARTIFPNGKVIEVDKKNIKDYREEDGNKYKIFAMEGLEPGCEVEYSYTFKQNLSFFGRETVQNKFPVVDAFIEIRTPPRLIFQIKGYNCDIDVTDTILNGRRIFSTHLRGIMGADEEKYAAYEANLQRVEYRLSYNTDNGAGHVRLNSWNALAKSIYAYYSAFSEKEVKRTQELIESNGWDKLATEQEKIVAVENHLKKLFTTREDIDIQNAGNIEWILKNKIASQAGMIRLYEVIFEKLGIDNQIALTADRNKTVIDRSFENWNSASNFLFYFPALKKFLAPTLLQMRYPWINPYWGDQNALFCRTTTIGTFTTAIAEIRTVPLEDYTKSFNRIEVSLHLNPNLDTVLVDLKQSYGGYSSIGFRSAFNLGNAEEQRVMIKDMAKSSTNSENIVSSNIENAGLENYNENKPFTLKATIKSGELLESAGNKILVKIGAIIGPQIEMYQEKPRQFPMQVAYPHTLERSIDLTIPDGYRIKNPDDLVLRQEFKTDGEITMGFVSEYKTEGNILRIHVLEQYRRTYYPLTEYENFRKVINSAADFNKITLVLEKK